MKTNFLKYFIFNIYSLIILLAFSFKSISNKTNFLNNFLKNVNNKNNMFDKNNLSTKNYQNNNNIDYFISEIFKIVNIQESNNNNIGFIKEEIKFKIISDNIKHLNFYIPLQKHNLDYMYNFNLENTQKNNNSINIIGYEFKRISYCKSKCLNNTGYINVKIYLSNYKLEDNQNAEVIFLLTYNEASIIRSDEKRSFNIINIPIEINPMLSRYRIMFNFTTYLKKVENTQFKMDINNIIDNKTLDSYFNINLYDSKKNKLLSRHNDFENFSTKKYKPKTNSYRLEIEFNNLNIQVNKMQVLNEDEVLFKEVKLSFPYSIKSAIIDNECLSNCFFKNFDFGSVLTIFKYIMILLITVIVVIFSYIHVKLNEIYNSASILYSKQFKIVNYCNYDCKDVSK